MAIVEDEVRNDCDEESDMVEVVVEDDGEQISDDDSDDDEDEEEAMETKVAELERRIAEDPYNYDDHIELIQALWGLSELDRWRSAFDQLQQMSLLKPEHWLLRLQTEVSLAHSPQAQKRIADLFEEATLDCYSIPLLSEWCTLILGSGDAVWARSQLDEVLRRAGPDPLSGKIFWDAKAELEKLQLESMSEEDPNYKSQLERVLFCLEETVSRPLLHGEEAWPQLQEIALKIHNQTYIDKLKIQHEAAVDLLQKLTPYEDRLLTLDDPEEKAKVYEEYADAVTELSNEKRFAECDCDGILKVVLDRWSSTGASTVCTALDRWLAVSSRASRSRVLRAALRRRPGVARYWGRAITDKEAAAGTRDEVKSILETALSKGMETYKDAESLWMTYLEYMRRQTDFKNETEVERLQRTFRLAWDSLAETWGAEANECEVPVFWARLEYKKIGDHKQGKEIFEEIFKYGENKTLSNYWVALISLESNRCPPPSDHKLRELHRRALKFVKDYPPAIARLYTDAERDNGTIDTMKQCVEECEEKIKEWRETLKAMNNKISAQKQKGKHSQSNKKTKPDKNKKNVDSQNKSKRKAEDTGEGSDVKKKRDSGMDIDESDKDANTSSSSLKRSHEGDDIGEGSSTKRQRRDSSTDSRLEGREACTLFVSNLEFKVSESELRARLSAFGRVDALRLRAGLRAFGGSICYCQYAHKSSVDEALKHDRSPLNGRPMFFSRYSAKKGEKTFKYSTAEEKNKLFVKNLPFEHCTKEDLSKVFEKYGELKDIRIVTYKDGRPKGLAYVEYASEESAIAAIEGTKSLTLGDRKVEVAHSAPPAKTGGSGEETPGLGQGKRETGSSRRTQLSTFIPSVLAKASTSQSNGSHTNGEKRPLSNTDFRALLLKK